MSYVERADEEIIAAWKYWLERHPNPNAIMIVCDDGKTYTVREVTDVIKDHKSDFVKSFVEESRNLAKKNNKDPVEMIKTARTDSCCAIKK